jgi:hypothetical protein
MIIELNMVDMGGLPVNIDILLLIAVQRTTFISKPSMQYTKISVSKRKIRRYSFRLKIFLLQFGFKRRECQVPNYLTELVPPTVADTNNYNLRNILNISQPSRYK